MIFFDLECAHARITQLKEWTEHDPFDPIQNKIICIVAQSHDSDEHVVFSGDDEAGMITEFFSFVGIQSVCWHNIKNFDLGFIVKRALIHWIKIPQRFKVYWEKPWNISGIYDTKEAWNYLSYNGKGTLNDIAIALGIKSPKEDMDWSMVNVAYLDGRLDEIISYCKEDVRATKEVYIKLHTLNFM